ncbi:MAG: helix-turn-helix domain-containing protein [Rothia sp. (in: high G+C Gram-positive bacteria)]|nr:helix-turn-helix domain-containing protein [Rothia sp. (in: high G+C Gram-positive bacteria)]
MVAENPVRRKKTARELAEQLGISQSTVRRLMAEPRADYLARANTKREQVAELRAQGLSVRAIANKLEISKSTVGRYVQEYENKLAIEAYS